MHLLRVLSSFSACPAPISRHRTEARVSEEKPEKQEPHDDMYFVMRHVHQGSFRSLFLSYAGESIFARVLRLCTQLFFDAEELVVFRDAVGAGRRPGFYLAGVQSDCKVGDEGIGGLAAGATMTAV